MLDHLLAVILFGLGLNSPLDSQNILGAQTNKQLAIMARDDSDHSGSGGGHSNDSTEGSGSSGSSGATGTSSEQAENETHMTPSATPFMIDGIPSNVSAERRDMYKKEMEKRKKELEAKRKALETQFKQKRDALKTSFTESKDAYRTQKKGLDDLRLHMEEERTAFLDSIKTSMEQSGTEREKRIQTLKDKINKFKDQVKKTKVEDIQTKITSFVTKRISIMTTNITKMTDLVGLNKTQVAERANGKDTTAFDAAAAAALTAINAAKDKLTELSSKQYVVTVTSETTVKNDVETVKKAIEEDLKVANELMKNARIAVSKMITERAKLLGEPVPDAVIK